MQFVLPAVGAVHVLQMVGGKSEQRHRAAFLPTTACWAPIQQTVLVASASLPC